MCRYSAYRILKGRGKRSKNSGFFGNPFGGLFDFNSDGKEDAGERLLGYKIFEDCTENESPAEDFSDPDYDDF